VIEKQEPHPARERALDLAPIEPVAEV
jgi:hypothetical protein